MYVGDKNWAAANDELFEAFKSFDNLGESGKAKTLLKYLILGSIIGDSKLNYADTQEAKVYQDDPDISIVIQLRQAYDEKAMNTILKLLDKMEMDDFIESIIDDFLRSV